MNGYLNHKEFLEVLKSGVVRGDILDNIDDCYIDKEESEDTSPVTDHWAKQLEVLTKHTMRRGRFLRAKLRTRKLPENE